MSAFDGAKSFLATTTLNTFIDEHTCNLATLTEYTTIGDAMKILAEKHIMSSPVLDEDGEYSGCVSVGDILKGATKDFVEAFGPHYSETISQIDAAKLTEVGEDFTGKAVRAILHDGDLWLKGDPTTSVLDVVMNGFNIQERQVHHRIYVCDPAKKQHIVSKDRTTVVNIEPGSEKLQASGWKPTDVVSQLDIVIALADNKDILADVVGQSLESIEAFMGTEATVAGNVTALEAFHHMAEDHKSTLGITDASGKLVGNLSVSDLRYLPSNAFGLLLRPVAEYVALVHGKEATLADAVAGARVKGAEQGDWATVLAGSPMVLLKPSTTFGEMLDAFKQNRAHRVHIVDDEGKPLSIITLTDVLRLVTKTPKPEQVPVTVGADEDMEDDDE